MNDFANYLAEDARLVILRTLAAESNNTLNEALLTRALEIYGHRRSREYVRTQIRKLAELEAVTFTEAGTIMVATLTRAGLDHVERRSRIEGITRPSLEH